MKKANKKKKAKSKLKKVAKGKLEEKQHAFCREYIIDFNGAQAAIRAGYSKKTANVLASQLLTKLNVQTEISRLKKIALDRNEITIDKVLKELSHIGFSNIQDYISSDNAINDISKVNVKKASAVESIKTIVTEWGGNNAGSKTSVTFKLHDKLSALDKIAKYLGMYAPEKIEHTGAVTVSQTPFSIKKRSALTGGK